MRALPASSPRRRRRTVGAAIALVAGLSSLAVRLPTVVLVASMIVLLAGIDIAGALAAKTWTDAPRLRHRFQGRSHSAGWLVHHVPGHR